MAKFWVILILVVASGISLCASLARAEDGEEAAKGSATKYEKLTKMNFEEKSVDGEFLRPEGQAVDGDQNLDFDTLMAPRNSFQKELQRSSGAVR